MDKVSAEDKMGIQTLREQRLGHRAIMAKSKKEKWSLSTMKAICKRFHVTKVTCRKRGRKWSFGVMEKARYSRSSLGSRRHQVCKAHHGFSISYAGVCYGCKERLHFIPFSRLNVKLIVELCYPDSLNAEGVFKHLVLFSCGMVRLLARTARLIMMRYHIAINCRKFIGKGD
jgi:hypothetical protein